MEYFINEAVKFHAFVPIIVIKLYDIKQRNAHFLI